MQILNFLKKFLTRTMKFTLDLIFPIECAICGKTGVYLCGLCEGKVLHHGKSIYECGGPRPYDVLAAYEYENRLFAVTLVEKLKYKFSQEIAGILGRILYKRFEDFLRGAADSADDGAAHNNFAITFVPIHKKRFLWRGFNQAQMIAKVLADLSGLPFAEYLVKIRNTPPQVGLKRTERLKNLVDVFALQSNVRLPKNIILIDDVSTTGTTIKECAKVLKDNGAERVVGMVVCKRV